jgi:hypothetical protein
MFSFSRFSYRGHRHGALDWMKKYFGKAGELAAYRKFSMNGFDHFGEPYNHLIAKAKDGSRMHKPNYPGELIGDTTGWKPERKPCGSGQLDDVAECEVDPQKPDGFHTQAAFLGFDPNATHVDTTKCADFKAGSRPPYCIEFMRRYYFAGNGNLFVNWHPAALGHEVIGNQMAYFYLGVLEAALQKVALDDKEVMEEVVAAAAIQPLPVNVMCSDLVCSQNFEQQCAYSYWPKAQGPDLGDWMNNATGSTWVNKAW